MKKNARSLARLADRNKYLTDLLSNSANWTLCNFAPESVIPNFEVDEADFPLSFSIEGFVVYVDMVTNHQVLFKLTPETIESLISVHQTILSTASSRYGITMLPPTVLGKVELIFTLNFRSAEGPNLSNSRWLLRSTDAAEFSISYHNPPKLGFSDSNAPLQYVLVVFVDLDASQCL